MDTTLSPAGDSIEIRDFRQADNRRFHRLFEMCFGRVVDGMYSDWKFRDHPYGPAIRLVAVECGEAVGFANLVPMPLWHEGKPLLVCQSVDTMVDPRVRCRGLFTRLTRAILDRMEERGFAAKLNFPGEMSKPGYERLGHTTLMHLDYWARWSLCARLRSLAMRVRPSVRSRSTTLAVRSSGVIPVVRFGGEVDQFWRRARMNGNTMQLRTSDMLNWRYVDRPDRRYEAFAYVNEGTWQGYVVVRNANIIDMLTAGNDEIARILLAVALSRSAEKGEPWTHMWASPAVASENVLRSVGLRKVDAQSPRRGLYPRQPVCLYLPHSSPSALLALSHPGPWYLTMCDTYFM